MARSGKRKKKKSKGGAGASGGASSAAGSGDARQFTGSQFPGGGQKMAPGTRTPFYRQKHKQLKQRPSSQGAAGSSGGAGNTQKGGDGKSAIPNIRTYQSDVNQAVKSGDASKTTMYLSEAERKRRKGEESAEDYIPTPPRKSRFGLWVMIGLTALFLLGGGGTLYYVFVMMPAQEPEERDTLQIPELINVDAQEEIAVTPQTKVREKVRGVLEQNDAPVNTVLQLYLTTERVTQGDTERVAREVMDTATFLERIRAEAPSALMRSLSPQFMLGIHTFDGDNPFLILKTDSYANTYAGMLAWEEELAEQIGPLLGVAAAGQREEEDENATGTVALPETERQPIAALPAQSKVFADEVLFNRDARVMRDPQGAIRLLYVFADQETVVITTSKDTLKELLTRLRTKKLER